MFAYVARQPIFDRDKQVYAYELLFRDGVDNRFPDINPDEATSKILAASHLSLGVEEISDGKLAYINFHEDTLLYRFPTSLDPKQVIIEVVETVQITNNLLLACKHIFDMGYKVALDDYDFDPKWDQFMDYISVVKVDVLECGMEKVRNNVHRLKEYPVKIIAEKVETYETFEELKELGFHYFQGFFFAYPEVIKHKRVGASQASLLELMEASSRLEFDFDHINNILERDVALSYMLLRFINNPTVNKRNKINSLRHALNYMGEVEIRKFIALMALAKLNADKPAELVHVSLVRARFCELIADHAGESNNPPKGFLVGLFSTLDAMLDQTMSGLMSKVPIDDTVREALCGEDNNLHQYLGIARAYESGDWKTIESTSESLNINTELMDKFYQDAIKWGADMKTSA